VFTYRTRCVIRLKTVRFSWGRVSSTCENPGAMLVESYGAITPLIIRKTMCRRAVCRYASSWRHRFSSAFSSCLMPRERATRCRHFLIYTVIYNRNLFVVLPRSPQRPDCEHKHNKYGWKVSWLSDDIFLSPFISFSFSLFLSVSPSFSPGNTWRFKTKDHANSDINVNARCTNNNVDWLAQPIDWRRVDLFFRD